MEISMYVADVILFCKFLVWVCFCMLGHLF